MGDTKHIIINMSTILAQTLPNFSKLLQHIDREWQYIIYIHLSPEISLDF